MSAVCPLSFADEAVVSTVWDDFIMRPFRSEEEGIDMKRRDEEEAVGLRSKWTGIGPRMIVLRYMVGASYSVLRYGP